MFGFISSLFSALLASKKVLGMNSRNLTYVRPNNLKNARKLADDKIKSKMMLKKHNIPTPDLIAKIASREELEKFDWESLPDSFVLKPNSGLGGSGIVIVYARKKGEKTTWIKSNGKTLNEKDLINHINNILDGAFSITNSADIAFFEERLKISKELKPYSYKGIPDIRIIIYNNVPVMAMLRLPTKSSDGKANLQQGGIGVGIDIETGTTTTAVQGKSKIIDYIPKTRMLLRGIKIPYWDEMLEYSVKAQQASGLGYLGADIAIDRDKGPVFLELNAQPGLSIQIANMAGLKSRLERVEGLKIKNVTHGVRVGKNLFGGEIEQELEEASGKKVIGSIEKVLFNGLDNKKIEVSAKIDTGAYSTSIDIELAKKLGYTKTIEAFSKIDLSQFDIKPGNELKIKKEILDKYRNKVPFLDDVAVVFASSGSSIRPVIKTSMIIDNRKVIAKINIIDRSNLKYSAIIGKRNLHKFLVDVTK